MSDLGGQLKQAREGRGISLRQIASSTKISTAALEALERGDLTKLPGGIFSRAFVRAYAIEVGLDPDQIVEQFLAELAIQTGRANQDAPSPEVSADDRAFLEQQRRAALILRIAGFVLLGLIVAGIVAWQMFRGGGDDGAPATNQTPPTAAEASPTPTPVETPASSGVAVEITAIESCWVQITTDGDVSPGRVFSPGERQRYDAKREVVLQVGSAGAISWLVNGRPAKPLGQVGEVKTVRVSLENAAEFYR